MMDDKRMEHDLYIRTMRFIRSYPKLHEKYMSAIGRSPVQDGMPKANNISDPTARVGINLIELAMQMRAIERGIGKVPQGYQRGLWNNVMYHIPYPYIASESTWRRWRYRFAYYVAVEMGWTE